MNHISPLSYLFSIFKLLQLVVLVNGYVSGLHRLFAEQKGGVRKKYDILITMLPFRNKKIARWLFVLLVFLILAYAFFEARNIVQGPQILIATPPGGTTVTSQLVEITGNTKNIQDITLDGRDIYIDEDGVFTERLLLSPG
jgi:hypothetical protein